jgi:hypothetical protein
MWGHRFRGLQTPGCNPAPLHGAHGAPFPNAPCRHRRVVSCAPAGALGCSSALQRRDSERQNSPGALEGRASAWPYRAKHGGRAEARPSNGTLRGMSPGGKGPWRATLLRGRTAQSTADARSTHLARVISVAALLMSSEAREGRLSRSPGRRAASSARASPGVAGAVQKRWRSAWAWPSAAALRRRTLFVRSATAQVGLPGVTGLAARACARGFTRSYG